MDADLGPVLPKLREPTDKFYVVPTFRINEEKPCGRTIGLQPLKDLAGRPTPYSDLAATVTRVAESIPS